MENYDWRHFLPQHTALGKDLRMVEVLSYYDQPVSFICKNKDDVHYLAFLAEENVFGKIYIYALLNDINDERPIAEIVKKSEKTYYVHELNYSESTHLIQLTPPSEILQEYLPHPAVKIKNE